MARKKKEVVTLEHRTFGKVTLKSSFFLASSGAKFFTVLTEEGEKKLLASPEYWLSPAQVVSAAFEAFSAKALVLEKAKRAAERKKEIYAAKNLSPDKRVRAIFKSGDEVEDFGIDDAEQKHKSDEVYAAGEW